MKYDFSLLRVAVLAMISLLIAMPVIARNMDGTEYSCNGALSIRIDDSWKSQGELYIRRNLYDLRLQKKGDTYALYEVEVLLHNLFSMYRRCGRTDAIKDLANLVSASYAKLEPAPIGAGQAWICRGGANCRKENRLLNTEVSLYSLQFLAFATDVAESLSLEVSREPSNDFLPKTVAVALDHLRRSSSEAKRRDLRLRLAAKPGESKGGSGQLFFSDEELWLLAIFSNVALLSTESQQGRVAWEAVNAADRESFRASLRLLFKLFTARVVMDSVEKQGASVEIAELDLGFRQNHFDNYYAGYEGAISPEKCSKDLMKKDDARSAVSPSPVSMLGLDISHARRLVHVFDSLQRGRMAISVLFDIPASEIPSDNLMKAFATQFRIKVWNGDAKHPLFRNYFGGQNGWYRASSASQSAPCREGVPPFGLSDSFLTGGYIEWSKWEPVLGVLGRNFYVITQSKNVDEVDFVQRFYARFGVTAVKSQKNLSELMFWPTLVGY